MHYSCSCQRHNDFSFILKKSTCTSIATIGANQFYSSKHFIATFSACKKSILIKLFQIILEHCQGIKR